MSVWMKTVFIWALCYLGAAVCILLDKPSEVDTSSAPANTAAPTVQPPEPQPKAKTFEPVLGVETPALIKRAHLFLSENDFDEAERYSEQALRQDPENSQAYLAKLMAQLKVHNTEELCRVDVSLADNRLFQYALRFAGNDEKTAIQKYLEDNAEHLAALQQEQQKIQDEELKQKEAEALEKKYQDAVNSKTRADNLRDVGALKRAAAMFDELGDYKDSKTLAEQARTQAVIYRAMYGGVGAIHEE